jgi:hypothetical protein
MSTVELEDYQVPEDPVILAPTKGYVVSFTTFYERGFDVPPHQFHHSLLRYYGLKLHHLAPSIVLHITAFMTLCEAYMGIIPNLDRWKYFFCVRRPQDPEVEITISGGAVIHLKWGHRVDPYREIPMDQVDEGVAEEMVLPKK